MMNQNAFMGKGIGCFNVDLDTNQITYSDKSLDMLGYKENYCNSFDFFLTRLHPNNIGLVYRISNLGVINKTNFKIKFRLAIEKNILARGKVIYDKYKRPKQVLWSILNVEDDLFFNRIRNKEIARIFSSNVGHLHSANEIQ